MFFVGWILFRSLWYFPKFFALVGNKSKLLALFLHLFNVCSVAMPTSRPYKHQKYSKKKTHNRRESCG